MLGEAVRDLRGRTRGEVVEPDDGGYEAARAAYNAMATGRPVVGSRVGAIPELLSGSMRRFLVEPDDPAALAKALQDLVDWRHFEPELGAECAEWVRRRFPFERSLAALERVLADAASTPVGRLTGSRAPR